MDLIATDRILFFDRGRNNRGDGECGDEKCGGEVWLVFFVGE